MPDKPQVMVRAAVQVWTPRGRSGGTTRTPTERIRVNRTENRARVIRKYF
jgi:hypothetical protein